VLDELSASKCELKLAGQLDTVERNASLTVNVRPSTDKRQRDSRQVRRLMAYQIEKKESFFEVRVLGNTSKPEILEIIRELDRRDRGKHFPDLWIIAKESQVPFVHFREIAEEIRSLLPCDAIGNKTAIVAAGEFYKAQLELYRSEASILPFEIRVFLSRDEAVEWIKNPEDPTTSSTRLQ
jgi:hypothetical protein